MKNQPRYGIGLVEYGRDEPDLDKLEDRVYAQDLAKEINTFLTNGWELTFWTKNEDQTRCVGAIVDMEMERRHFRVIEDEFMPPNVSATALTYYLLTVLRRNIEAHLNQFNTEEE